MDLWLPNSENDLLFRQYLPVCVLLLLLLLSAEAVSLLPRPSSWKWINAQCHYLLSLCLCFLCLRALLPFSPHWMPCWLKGVSQMSGGLWSLPTLLNKIVPSIMFPQHMAVFHPVLFPIYMKESCFSYLSISQNYQCILYFNALWQCRN
jgi:hypothetical protein